MNAFAILLVLLMVAVSTAFQSFTRPRTVRGASLDMSTIVVFGGTGKTGAECVYQALEQGYKVVVLARSPEKMLYPEGSGGAANAGKVLANDNLKVEGRCDAAERRRCRLRRGGGRDHRHCGGPRRKDKGCRSHHANRWYYLRDQRYEEQRGQKN